MHRRIVPVQELPTIYLKPGEMHFGSDAARVITVLGSCVSVIMYHRSTSTGAICHAVMPSSEAPRSLKRASKDLFQYVNTSLEWMIAQFEKLGIKKTDIEVKIFGGSEMFTDANGRVAAMSVGRKNIEAAMRFIQDHNLRLKAWNIGGNKGRKVIFYSDTGEVFTKFVNKVEQQVFSCATGKDR